jgi:hypothetical protein
MCSEEFDHYSMCATNGYFTDHAQELMWKPMPQWSWLFVKMRPQAFFMAIIHSVSCKIQNAISGGGFLVSWQRCGPILLLRLERCGVTILIVSELYTISAARKDTMSPHSPLETLIASEASRVLK